MGAPPPFWGRGAGFAPNTKSPEPRLTSLSSGILLHAAIYPQQTWAENQGARPFFGRGAGSPSNTMWPGPSFIMIHPTVWPQYTNVTDRTDRQDRQRCDSIGRTFYKRSPKYYKKDIRAIMSVSFHSADRAVAVSPPVTRS